MSKRLIVVEDDGLRRIAVETESGLRFLEGVVNDDGTVDVFIEGYTPPPSQA